MLVLIGIGGLLVVLPGILAHHTWQRMKKNTREPGEPAAASFIHGDMEAHALPAHVFFGTNITIIALAGILTGNFHLIIPGILLAVLALFVHDHRERDPHGG